MVRLIEAPDLRRKVKTRLLEAPDLRLNKPIIIQPAIVQNNIELESIRKDISELRKAITQVIEAEVHTEKTIIDLSNEREKLITGLTKLGDTIKGNNISPKAIKTLTTDIDSLFDEIKRLGEEITKRSDYISFGGGISKSEAVAAVKADGGIVLTSPPEGYKKVSNIYIEPQAGVLVGEQEV